MKSLNFIYFSLFEITAERGRMNALPNGVSEVVAEEDPQSKFFQVVLVSPQVYLTSYPKLTRCMISQYATNYHICFAIVLATEMIEVNGNVDCNKHLN